MEIIESIEAIREAIGRARTAGMSLALVPTMGALHEGHVSLMQAARDACDRVVVSIFVNPTQFTPGEDYRNYPRTPQADLEVCRRHGVDVVFMPSVDTMVGSGGLTEVTVRKLDEVLCGRNRPGHFTGVCTVVAKLFHIVQPDKAFFGAKDFQQAAILHRMVRDLHFPVKIVVCPTVREPDGLAVSSRNAYLTAAQRLQAVGLSEALQQAAETIRASHPPAEQVIQAIRRHLADRTPDGQIDYVQIVDPEDLCDVETTDKPVRVVLAVKLGVARLIDNTLVDDPPAGS